MNVTTVGIDLDRGSPCSEGNLQPREADRSKSAPLSVVRLTVVLERDYSHFSCDLSYTFAKAAFDLTRLIPLMASCLLMYPSAPVAITL